MARLGPAAYFYEIILKKANQFQIYNSELGLEKFLKIIFHVGIILIHILSQYLYTSTYSFI